MISFKQFLTKDTLTEGVVKSWTVSDTDVKSAIDMLNKYCKHGLLAIKNDGLLYRGFGSTGPASKNTNFQIIDTTNSERTSRDYDNAYMLLMSASKHMEEIPSRTNSLICSSSWLSAYDYSGKHMPKIVVPFDGTTVAYVNGSDFNEVEENGSALTSIGLTSRLTDVSLYEFFNMMLPPTKTTTQTGSTKHFTSHVAIDAAMAKYSPLELAIFWWMSIQQNPNGITVAFKVVKSNPVEADRLADLIDSLSGISPTSLIKHGEWTTKPNKQIFDAIIQGINEKLIVLSSKTLKFYNIMKQAPADKRFTYIAEMVARPKKLGIKTVDFGNKLPWNVECWVSGKAVLISHEMMKAIVNTLHEQDPKSVHKNVYATLNGY